MCLGKVVYPQGYKFFERPQGGLKGLRWPVQAMLVCGHTPLCAKQDFCVKEGLSRGLSHGVESNPPAMSEARVEGIAVAPPESPHAGLSWPAESPPQAEMLFELSKWGMKLPTRRDGRKPSFLRRREVRLISQNVLHANGGAKQEKEIRPIFVTQGRGRRPPCGKAKGSPPQGL